MRNGTIKKLILIVTSEQAVRCLVRLAADKSHCDVVEAINIRQAERKMQDRLPDLILLDSNLLQQNKSEFILELRQKRLTQNISVILLTDKNPQRSQPLDVSMDIMNEYVIKPLSLPVLMASIQTALHQHPKQLPNGTIQVRHLIVDTISEIALIAGKKLKLNPLEYRLLSFFVTNPGRIYSRAILVNHVWGEEKSIDQRVVDTHIRRLRKRLSFGRHDRLIQTVHGAGYRFSEDE